MARFVAVARIASGAVDVEKLSENSALPNSSVVTSVKPRMSRPHRDQTDRTLRLREFNTECGVWRAFE